MALDLTHTAALFGENISSSVTAITSEDITTATGFAQNQLQSLAQQSALVAGMIEANAFTAAERDFYLDGLGQMARGFAETLVQMIVVEIEKLYNAIVTAIYDSINKVAGVALIVPHAAV